MVEIYCQAILSVRVCNRTGMWQFRTATAVLRMPGMLCSSSHLPVSEVVGLFSTLGVTLDA